MGDAPARRNVPSVEDITIKTKQAFGFAPCQWQIEAAQHQLAGDHTLVLAPTGGGKTLPFWIPLLFDPDTLLLIITPLNGLASQHSKRLSELGFKAIAYNSETNLPETKRVSTPFHQT
jgi:superfamily II DNA helicase RecQ